LSDATHLEALQIVRELDLTHTVAKLPSVEEKLEFAEELKLINTEGKDACSHFCVSKVLSRIAIDYIQRPEK
jgi:hypothetical protein